jgi:hypothetical protein
MSRGLKMKGGIVVETNAAVVVGVVRREVGSGWYMGKKKSRRLLALGCSVAARGCLVVRAAVGAVEG